MVSSLKINKKGTYFKRDNGWGGGGALKTVVFISKCPTKMCLGRKRKRHCHITVLHKTSGFNPKQKTNKNCYALQWQTWNTIKSWKDNYVCFIVGISKLRNENPRARGWHDLHPVNCGTCCSTQHALLLWCWNTLQLFWSKSMRALFLHEVLQHAIMSLDLGCFRQLCVLCMDVCLCRFKKNHNSTTTLRW